MTVSTRRFDEQMAHLRDHHCVLSLAELAAALEAGARVPPNAVVVTFDDGYRDNLSVAAPIMQSYGIPATLFAATGPADRGELLWWDALELAGLGTRRHRAHAKYLPNAQLHRYVSDALVDVPRERIAAAVAETYLDWDGLRAWCGRGLELGAHTVTHPILSGLAAEDATAEIGASRDAIARHTGQRPSAFSYPNGTARDFTSETMRLVDRVGLRVACTSVAGLNTPETPLLALRRICARNEAVPFFALRLAGLAQWTGHRADVTARRLVEWLASGARSRPARGLVSLT
jgi:peptidoglycan/xylan/chitin deacetylase (PgdA/CDA1 family)